MGQGVWEETHVEVSSREQFTGRYSNLGTRLGFKDTQFCPGMYEEG